MKTPTDAVADEMLAVAVVDVARAASTNATGELVTRSHSIRCSRSLSPRLVTAGWKSPRNGLVLSSAIPERQTQADVVNSPRFFDVRFAHHSPTA